MSMVHAELNEIITDFVWCKAALEDAAKRERILLNGSVNTDLGIEGPHVFSRSEQIVLVWKICEAALKKPIPATYREIDQMQVHLVQSLMVVKLTMIFLGITAFRELEAATKRPHLDAAREAGQSE